MQTGNDEFEVSSTFKAYSDRYFALSNPSSKDLLQFYREAAEEVERDWEHNRGIAYHVTAAWGQNRDITEGSNLDLIGIRFSQLETPEVSGYKDNKEIRSEWQKLKGAILELGKVA